MNETGMSFSSSRQGKMSPVQHFKENRLVKVFGRFHRFPARLSVPGSFCVICIECMLHSP